MDPANPQNPTPSPTPPPTPPVQEPISQSKVTAQKEARDKNGRFIKVGQPTKDIPLPPLISKTDTTGDMPALLSFKITNPVEYLKVWWKKIISNEGIHINIWVKPLTTLLIVAAILGGTFSFGFVVSALRKVPVVNQILPPVPVVTPSPNPNHDAAYSGILRQSGNKFYLQTGDGQAINLIIPSNVRLDNFVGKRIFATGTFNTQTGFLTVTDATDLEVLPQQVVSIPTTAPTLIPTLEPTIAPTEIPSPTPTS